MTRAFFVFLVLFASASLSANDFKCEIVDTDTDASLENAGVNPTCPDIKIPWACYCDIEEECKDDSGKTFTFHRSILMGCGKLSDCMFHTPFGRRCDAMEG